MTTTLSRFLLADLPTYTVEVDGDDPRFLSERFEGPYNIFERAWQAPDYIPMAYFFPVRRGQRIVRCVLLKMSNFDYGTVLGELESLSLSRPDRSITEAIFHQLKENPVDLPVISFCGTYHQAVVWNWGAHGVMILEPNGQWIVATRSVECKLYNSYVLAVVDEVPKPGCEPWWKELRPGAVRPNRVRSDAWVDNLYQKYHRRERDMAAWNNALRSVLRRAKHPDPAIGAAQGSGSKSEVLGMRRVRYATYTALNGRATYNVAWMAQLQSLSFPDFATADAILVQAKREIHGPKPKAVICFLGHPDAENGYYFIAVDNEGRYRFGMAAIYGHNFRLVEDRWGEDCEFVGIVEEF